MFTYIYNIKYDFSCEIISIEELEQSIILSLEKSLDSISITEEDCELIFEEELTEEEILLLDSLISEHKGKESIYKSTNDGVLRASIEPPEGSRKNFISPNWGDKCTWYWDSEKIVSYELQNSGNNLTYEGYGIWVDNYHGRYSDEDTLTNKDGDIPRLRVYVNGIEKSEQNPHYESGGDYVVNYESAQVTFLEELNTEDIVSVDAFLVKSSEWSVLPMSNKKLKVDSVEVQFSKDLLIKDSVRFELWLINPYNPSEKIMYNYQVFKTMMDYINEANGSYPVVPANASESADWRDLKDSIITLSWKYQAITELKSSMGMEIKIKLDHDASFDGFASATFYCRSFEE